MDENAQWIIYGKLLEKIKEKKIDWYGIDMFKSV